MKKATIDQTKEVVIDAENVALGRVASQVAAMLRGKNNPNFERHIASQTKVRVVNLSKFKVTGTKRSDKRYKRYSGYPGGLRSEAMEHLIDRRGHSEVFRMSVRRMLPSNKLRAVLMKNLITEN